MKVYKMALAVLMLMLVSIGAVAQVKVVFGEKGEEKFPGTGGTITVSQDTKGDEVTVTLTVTPDKGYTITKGDIKVYATYPPSGTRTPEIADNLTLYYNGSEKEDVKDPSEKRDYTFTIGSNFGAWVKEANFSSDSKGPQRGDPTEITDLSDMSSSGDYIITADIDASGFTESIDNFTGTLTALAKSDGTFPVISNLSVPLFTTVTGATVNNIMFKEVKISGSGPIGAICGTAEDTTHIYNCGILPSNKKYDAENETSYLQSTSGNNSYCGGLVGWLKDYSRVINCFSYANITGGSDRGGIVGYNGYASKHDDIRTMIMNCMFYGNIATGGTNRSPIYGGNDIDNRADKSRLNTFNYYRYEPNKNNINKYNCALAIEDKFLVRFEFYRQLLNSNRPLAAWYAINDNNLTDAQKVEKGKYENNEMAKWVLDKSIAPYPILKKQGEYPSIANYDEDKTFDEDGNQVNRNDITVRSRGGFIKKNGVAQELTINISLGQNYPSNFALKAGMSQITRKRIDKDTLNYNFNYDKVQLPYFNEVGTGNYMKDGDGKSRVVTGWKITGMTPGGGTDDATLGTFNPADEYGGYNFADRMSYAKDIYAANNLRVFSQGAYFDVPYGVTAITIEPYYGYAAYVADAWLDVTYLANDTYGNNNGNNTAVFKQYTSNGVDCMINGVKQKVYTSISNALNQLSGSTVYDNAVVLVGNFHLNGTPSNGDKAFSMMSADLDFDNEPDNSLIYHHSSRVNVSPIRYDFLNIPGTAMAQKPKNASRMLNMSIYNPKGWFEVTNTCNIYFVQFEYFNGQGKVKAPVIFQGGMVDQFVSTKIESPTNQTSYIHVGGNAWFLNFGNGTHSDGFKFTPHIPISVTGGDYVNFYLSGTYRPDAMVKEATDDAECYISGGRFGELAGAAQQQINGSVQWQIYDADIRDFFGGGVNADKPITGDITVNIYNSHVTTYCGGPKFGDMPKQGQFQIKYSTNQAGTSTETKTITISEDRKVTTNAKGCTFGRYFGAGYGGTSFLRKRYYDDANSDIGAQETNYTNNRGKYFDGLTTNIKDGKAGPGIAADFDYELFPWSDGRIGSRFYVKFASFSLAKTNNVVSKLKNCTITGSFYGGGHLGQVLGTATSELDGCKVYGNVFGGGYSASVPKVPVRDAGFSVKPEYKKEAGILTTATFSSTTEYQWSTHALPNNGNDAITTSDSAKEIWTTDGLNTLGQVKETKLTIKGNTYVRGMVDGNIPEPDAGYADIDDASVLLYGVSTGGTLYGGVFGGGDASAVNEDTEVLIDNSPSSESEASKTICNVFGGGNVASVGGNTKVTIQGGTIEKNVFGGGKGEADEFSCSKAMVGVNNAGAGADLTTEENKNKGTKVTISNGTISNGTVNGNVYGGGEVGRVEWNTQVTIGAGEGTPIINGSVFGAGAGVATHGYAALVRGNSTVTIQGNAKVLQNVYGGGEQATVGRYWVKGVNDNVTGAPTAPTDTPDEMPYQTMSGGKCTVVVQGSAQVGPDSNVPITAGHVFGAGKGVTPNYVHTGDKANWSKRMVDYNSKGTTWDYYEEYTEAQIADTYFPKYVWEYFVDDADQSAANYKSGEDKYLEFLQTLALVTGTDVTIGGGTVKGSVFGGSESGYVQDDTDVKVNGGTIGTTGNGGAYYGNVYGGGKGDAEHTGTNHNYVAAGLVKGNTKVTISNGTILHNIYGGGAYGSVGEFTYDVNTGMPTGRLENTTGGKAEVIITGGTIGTTGEENGMIFGSSRGDVGAPDAIHDKLAWVYDTHVAIGDTTENATITTAAPLIRGSIYGGGENGHNFRNSYVRINGGTIGIPSEATYAYRGNVYGGGCGTDKYDNNTKYNPKAGIVQGNAFVNITGGFVVHNVYGAGAMGSVGTDTSGGKTTVSVSGGRIGYDGNSNGNVYGAARGDLTATGNLAQVRETAVNISYSTTPTADNEGKTAQLIAGSVFGGGEAGTVKESVAVSMTGGLILNDVYGGGALANTQTSNWDNNAGNWATGKTSASSTTTVSLTGGLIKGDAYGGGLGQIARTGANPLAAIPAYVWGDVTVKLNEGKTANDTGCKVSRIFGCNNQNGTPKGKVQVYVYATQNKDKENIGSKYPLHTKEAGNLPETGSTTTYDVKAVYGGGNLSAYVPVNALLAYDDEENPPEAVAAARSEVYIYGCQLTSIKQVYAGGNAASAPATYVWVDGSYEIEELFGGGNGNDPYELYNAWYQNPGANVGYYDYTERIDGGDGSLADPYKCQDKPEASFETGSLEERLKYKYGSGITTTEVHGGKVHYVYGGSNMKGNIRTLCKSSYEELYPEDCPVKTDETYGGGKKSNMDGKIDMELGCVKDMEDTFGGSKDADVNSDIVLTISNGNYKRVFGGNNTSGNVNGSITVIIKEEGCSPITINQLYAGGFLAGYSVYGYNADKSPRTEAQWNAMTEAQRVAEGFPTNAQGKCVPRHDPRIMVVSATRIDSIFGGGYKALVVGNPHVNVNMEKGLIPKTDAETLPEYEEAEKDAEGNMILPIGTVGNIYGGGNMADIYGDTYVEIGTGKCYNDDGEEETISRRAATITGNVYGGGKGSADTYECEAAMVGEVDKDYGSTHVIIGNGTVGTVENGKLKEGTGNVYGGGEIGRVEKNTSVTIGLDPTTIDWTSAPVIEGKVFGAGCGLRTHGYSALVRGDATVTIRANAQVKGNVYGGGEMSTVGKYWVKGVQYPASLNPPPAPDWVYDWMPYQWRSGGTCTVSILDHAVIGPDNNMKMKTDNGPDDAGHVFGACQGVLPYQGFTDTDRPWRMQQGDTKDYFYINNKFSEDEYFRFIETLALATKTEVTIGGNAFVMGSVYGGSENGRVQEDTHVTIQDNCQIGCGDGITTPDGKPAPYTAAQWESENPADFKECASWTFEPPYAPYDMYKLDANGKPIPATDGHTFFGNVFGGGSGYYPYKQDPDYEVRKSELGGKSKKELGYADGLWFENAGAVYGNTQVDITGGHILTSVYGGNEMTNVGTYKDDRDYVEKGHCVINISGGTVGVPRSSDDAKHHPVTCYVFGAGKGDPRINFNRWTNVASTEVNITGNARIFGSTFGGGEDGHVIGDAVTTVNGDGVKIGSTGTSGVDGNIFGGGRGFSEDALTAGVVGGNVTVNFKNGKILGTLYGGGRLASVGTNFANVEDTQHYGKMQADTETQTHGHITVNIEGGTIGATDDAGNLMASDSSIGDVFGGCKGSSSEIPKMDYGLSKITKINMTGGKVNGSVYGGGEVAMVEDSTTILISGAEKVDNVYGGGKGIIDHAKAGMIQGDTHVTISEAQGKTTTISHNVYGGGEAGVVNGNVAVDIMGGHVMQDVYGGGALANTNTGNWGSNNTWAEGKYSNLATFYKTNVILKGGTIDGNVYGGGLGRQEKAEVPAVEGSGTYGQPDYVEPVPYQPAVSPIKALVYGDVLVKLNENTEIDKCVVKGSVFGCNNLNGSPQSAVTVHVYKTWGDAMTAQADLDDPDDSKHHYHLAAVYGGGNQSAFYPQFKDTRDSVQTRVIIDGCDLTSIQQVYGGGNAASSPATSVTINSAYEIEEVFGGGNGYGTMPDGSVNPGANVGYTHYPVEFDPPASTVEYRTNNYGYGSGEASVNIFNGRIHRVFGGSNTKGNVRKSAVTILEKMSEDCAFVIDEVYGGGKSAPMDAEAKLLMSCIPGLKEVYGGAQNADINNNVVLNITNGEYDRVFGGNNISGTITGAITVNIEETGCKPVIIGQVYGGGNLAAYTGPWVDDNDHSKGRQGPTVNVKAFTSIGEIYGGGYGASATVTGDTYVNVNEVILSKEETGQAQDYSIKDFIQEVIDEDHPEQEYKTMDLGNDNKFKVWYRPVKKDSNNVPIPTMGVIGNVFGGGNAAPVEGSTHVSIGNKATETIVTLNDLQKEVKGVDIRGNVYGGGNKAVVTGDTNVRIGK